MAITIQQTGKGLKLMVLGSWILIIYAAIVWNPMLLIFGIVWKVLTRALIWWCHA